MSFQPKLWLSSAIEIDSHSWWKSQFWLKAHISSIFTGLFLLQRCQQTWDSGRCRSLSFFLKYVLSFYFSRFSFYTNIDLIIWLVFGLCKLLKVCLSRCIWLNHALPGTEWQTIDPIASRLTEIRIKISLGREEAE